MRLIPSPSSCLKTKVSIHASVKDATHADDVPDPNKNVSIHASVKDATELLGGTNSVKTVSIHASVKDATKVNDNEVFWF